MRNLVRLVAVVVLSAGMLPVFTGSAWACSCPEPPGDTTRYRQAAETAVAAYRGHVAGFNYIVESGGAGYYYYRVIVDEALKGSPGATGTLRASEENGACDNMRLQDGKPILVVDKKGDGRLSLCGDTTQDRVTRRTSIMRARLVELGLLTPTLPRTGPEGAVAFAALALTLGAAAAARARKPS